MSHHYDTSTYAADADQVSARLASPDQLRAAANAAFSEQEAVPDKLVYMFGSTRSGWAVYTVKELLKTVNLPSLRFLTDEGQHRFETEHGYTCISILSGVALTNAIDGLRQLLEVATATPILVLNADTNACLDVEGIATALARDYVTSKPAFDYGNVIGDDGQTADYLFAWLRGVLRIAEGAQSDGRILVHVLKV
jgi:hypothetical protein